MNTTTNEFLCFSEPMMHYLKYKGLRYLRVDNHRVTGKRFWVFAKSPELDEHLSCWTANKPA